MFNRPLKSVVVAALVAATPGCITQALWKPAGESWAVGPQIAGVVSNYPWPGARSLIVRYRAAGDGTDVDLVVPIKADGRAVEPFAVTFVPVGGGSAPKTAEPGNLEISGEGPRQSSPDDMQFHVSRAIGLTPERIAAITSTESTIPADRQRLALRLSSPNFTRIRTTQLDQIRDGAPDAGDTVHILVYRLDQSGELLATPVDNLPDHWNQLKPEDLLIAVPTAVPRPPGDQGRNQLVAGALTPVTVAGDIGATALLIGGGAAILGGALVVAVVVLPVAGVAAIVSAAGNHNGATSSPSQ
jgi:hypothetical protein